MPNSGLGAPSSKQRGEIRGVIQGIYGSPRFSKLLDQQLSPDIDQVARTIPRKFRWRTQPTGAAAETGFRLRESGLTVQALRSLGPDEVTSQVISKIRA